MRKDGKEEKGQSVKKGKAYVSLAPQTTFKGDLFDHTLMNTTVFVFLFYSLTKNLSFTLLLLKFKFWQSKCSTFTKWVKIRINI